MHKKATLPCFYGIWRIGMKKSRILNWLFAVIPVVGFCLIASNTGYSRDDWRYRFFFNGQDFNDAVQFNNFFVEIWQSLINHWEMWNGRAVAHFFVQGMMQLPHELVALVYTTVFSVLVILLQKIAINRVTLNSFLLVAVLIMLFWPAFGDSFLWISGVGNYALMIVLELSFVLVGMKFINSNHLVWSIVLLLLAPVIGNTSEIGGPAAFVFLTVYAVINKIVRMKMIQVIVADFLGIVGFLVIYFSPGTAVRKEKGDGELLVNLLPNLPKTVEIPQQQHLQGGQLLLSWGKWVVENSWPLWLGVIVCLFVDQTENDWIVISR